MNNLYNYFIKMYQSYYFKNGNLYHKLDDDVNNKKDTENTYKYLFNKYYTIIKNKCMLT